MEQNQITKLVPNKVTAGKLAAIKNMTDEQLLANTDRVVDKERSATLEVLLHLREVEVRRLFIDLKFSSMYKYCIKHLKYSEHEAQSRLAAARLLRELPEIEGQIENGDLSLTNLSAVQSFVRAEKNADMPLTREEKLELITTLENKPTRKVKEELIQHSHQPALLVDKFQISATAATSLFDSQPGFQITKFEASITTENLELLQEFRNLYAHDLQDLSNHSVLMFLLEKAVQHKKKKLGLIPKSSNLSDKPSRNNLGSIDENSNFSSKSLRKKLSQSKKFNAALPWANEVTVAKDTTETNDAKLENRRCPLSLKIRKQVWQRANACCEHVDAKTKTRCSSKFALETDHIIAVALGGSNELQNLQLLCRAHNSRRSIKTFGSWRPKTRARKAMDSSRNICIHAIPDYLQT